MRRKSRSRFARRPLGFHLERFEDRLTPALSAVFDPNFGSLVVTSDGSDDIIIGNDSLYHITLNGSPLLSSTGSLINGPELRALQVIGGNGPNDIDLSGLSSQAVDKLFSVRSTDWLVSVNGGGGDDTVTGCSFGCEMIGGSGADTLHGGQASDHLVLDSNDYDCDSGKGDDRVDLTIPSSATGLNITADPATDVSSFSWSGGQMLTISNGELFSITITGDFFSQVTTTIGNSVGCSATMSSSRRDAAGSSSSTGSVDIESPASGGFAAKAFHYDLKTLKKIDSMELVGGPGNDTFTIQPGAVPVSVIGGNGTDLLTVNNYGFPSSVTSSAVQVAGLAPVAFSDVDTAQTRRQLFDGDAIADLAAQGITFTATAKTNIDGSQTNTVTLTNNGLASVDKPMYDLKHAKKYHDDSLALIASTGSDTGGGPHVRFAGASAGTTISVFNDPNAPTSIEYLMMTGACAATEVIFNGPTTLPGGASMTGNWNDPTVGGQNRFSCVVTCTVGNNDYQFELRDFFQTGDKPTGAQFASLLDSTTAKTPSGGSSSVLAVDASGATQVVGSSASGIDSTITTLTPGLHVYVSNHLLDRVPGSSSSGNGQSGNASVSADGRWVVYQSTATNLDSSVIDANGQADICLTDTITGVTRVISRTALETGNGKSFLPRISADGSTIIFFSSATNLDASVSDSNNAPDLFSYDLKTQKVACLSRSLSQTTTGDHGVIDADLSGDGQTICWLTDATNVALGTPSGLHLAKKHIANIKWSSISLNTWSGTIATTGVSVAPDASSVFVWTDQQMPASLIGIPDNNGVSDIVRIDLSTDAAMLLTSNTAGTSTSNGYCPAPGERVAVSFDGSVCAFTSTATDLTTNGGGYGLYRVVVAAGAGGGPQVTRIDTFSSGGVGADNHSPSISADGTLIAFSSTTDYTSPSPTPLPASQIFVADTGNNRIQRVSQNRAGAPGNGNSTTPYLCPNGDCVSYSSLADNLIIGDGNLSMDAISTTGHHRWTIDLQAVSFPFSKVEIKYKGQDDRYVMVDSPTGTELGSIPAAGIDGITIYGRDGADDPITLDVDSGLTRLSSDVSVFGGTGNDPVTLKTLLMPALMKAKEKANRTKCSLVLDLPLDDGNGQSSMSSELRYYNNENCQWTLQCPSTASISYEQVADSNLATGAAVTLSRSTNDLVISNGFSSFVTTGYFASAAPREVDVDLGPYGDFCTLAVAGNPIPGVGIVVKGRLGNDTITAAQTTAVPVTIDGGDGDDNCTGGSMGDTMVISQGVDALAGGAGPDVYIPLKRGKLGAVGVGFDGPVPPPRILRFDCIINDPSGTNTLDFSYAPPVTFDMSSSAPQPCCPTCRIQYVGSPPNFIGSEFSDTVHVAASSVAQVASGDSELTGVIGDVLVVDAQGHPASDVGGKIVVSGFQPICHSGFESVSITNNAPTLQVADVTINDGSRQRSRVTSVTVAFNGLVVFGGVGPEAAFKLVGPGSSTIPLNASVSNNNGFTSVTLTFSGPNLDAGSLVDGRYTLSVFHDQVSNAVMGPLDGNADGMPGDDYTLTSSGTTGIFRLYGDADGNALVDGLDFGAFRSAFNTNSFAFDFDNNGVVDGTDFGNFRARFNKAV